MRSGIIIDGIEEKILLVKGEKELKNKKIEALDMHLSNDVSYSSIIKTNRNEDLLIKITPSKYGKTSHKIKFFFREIIAERLFFNVKTIREFKGIKKLQKTGVKTPKVYAAGYFITNKSKYSGIIIYERLHNQVTAKEYILSDESEENKKIVLDNIIRDYKKMSKKHIHFYDFHLNNLLVNKTTLDIYWIDPILKKIF